MKGVFHYLYLIIDIFSKKAINREVYEAQTAEKSCELIQKAKIKEGSLSTDFLVLHSDNGSPLKGVIMLETLYKLGITPSNSGPQVSNDNAFTESIFKTMKYRPNYQLEGFSSLLEARMGFGICQLVQR